MFFKNAQVYRLPENWHAQVSPADIDEQLCRRAFQPCGAQDAESRGWVSPAPQNGFSHLHTVGAHWMVCLQIETKILPAAVIKQEAEERAEVIAQQQGYKPGRKQMKEIREQVLQALLPTALKKRRKVFAWIDPVGGWLVIDAPSQARAEDVLEVLRQSLDVLPLGMVRTEVSPTSAMADWLAGGEGPEHFKIDQDCELRAVTEDKASVRYTRHSLEGDGIREHLTAGKLPTRLALTFDDRISFVLTEKLEIKRLDFLDVIQDELHTQQPEDAAQLFDAGFTLMSLEMSRLIPALVAAMGGELKPTTEPLA
jgi:recombination associated protein RdgC